jgi:hypothetical protein
MSELVIERIVQEISVPLPHAGTRAPVKEGHVPRATR